MEKITIKPELTAISKGCSSTVRHVDLRNFSNGAKILDFGCGRLRNSIALKEKGFYNIDVHDTEEQLFGNGIAKLAIAEGFHIYNKFESKKYEVVLCNYVLNTVLKDERYSIITKILSLLEDEGIAIFEVRTENDIIAKSKVQYEDGWLIKKGGGFTFQKGFTEHELVGLLEEFDGFNVEHSRQSRNKVEVIVKKTDKVARQCKLF